MHDGHRQRLKNRFLASGLDSFEDHEVLELLLYYTIPQGDTNITAHRLLDEFHSPRAVFEASIEDLVKVQGVGHHSAVFLKMVPQLSQYYGKIFQRDTTKLLTSHDAGMYVCSMIGCLSNEIFAIICLDAQNRVIKFEKIENGTVSQANVNTRKVVEAALKYSCSSLIFCHNHPSGTACASENDRLLTRELCSVFESMNIRVTDHIIALSPEKYISMSDAGLMPN